MACATSSGLPNRFKGYFFISSESCSSEIVPASQICVFIIPGHTAFTLIFLLARSNAAFLTKPHTAALDVEYITLPTPAITGPEIDEVNTTDPFFPSFFFFNNCCIKRIGAKVLTDITCSILSRVIK